VATLWSSSDSSLNITGVSNTPLAKTLTAGSIVLQLTLRSYSLTPGLSYVFRMTVSYLNISVSDAFAEATILVNKPPSGGRLVVSPTFGYYFKTSFFFSTYNWYDDVSDYPLHYSMGYYSVSADDIHMILTYGQVQFQSAYLGEGVQSLQYVVTGFVIAEDVFAGSSNATTTFTVRPAELSTADVASSMSSQLQLASETLNTDLVMQTVAMVSSSINAVNCSLAPDCPSLHRAACLAVPHTCGDCLAGYLGTRGAANTACNSSDNLSLLGQSCHSNHRCFSGRCQSGICVSVVKMCPGNCSSNGQCIFYDLYGNEVSDCSSDNYLCQAKCNCTANYFGKSCSLTSSDFSLQTSMRDAMCSSLFTTLLIQVRMIGT